MESSCVMDVAMTVLPACKMSTPVWTSETVPKEFRIQDGDHNFFHHEPILEIFQEYLKFKS